MKTSSLRAPLSAWLAGLVASINFPKLAEPIVGAAPIVTPGSIRRGCYTVAADKRRACKARNVRRNKAQHRARGVR